jgi:hypothetical protein
MATRTEGPITPAAPAAVRPDWRYGAAAALMLGLHAILAWVLRDPGILTAQDDATNLLVGRSLLEGGYNETFRVDAPFHVRYPPLYPAVLGVWDWAVGGRFDALLALNVGASTLALGALFLALKRGWGERFALVCLAPLAVNSYLLQMAGELRSESLYTLLVMLSLLAAARAGPEPRTLVTVGAAAIAAALTRSIGVTLVAAVGVHWLLERRARALGLFAVASAITVGSWHLWSGGASEEIVGRHYAADATYGMDTKTGSPRSFVLLDRVLDNAPVYLTRTLPYHMAVPNLPGTRLDAVPIALVLTLSLVIGLFMFLRRWRLAGLYVLAYAALLLAWPWRLGRFVIPVLPLLVPAAILGMGALIGQIGERWRMPAMLTFALALTAWGGARTTSWILQDRHCERGAMPPAASCVTRDQASFFEALRYVNRALPPDAVLLTAKPEPLHYYTGRLTVPYHRAIAQPDTLFLPFLQSYGAEFVLLGSLQHQEISRLLRRLEANCRDLALVAEFPPRTYLFRVLRPGEQPEEEACDAVAAARAANVGRNFWRDP